MKRGLSLAALALAAVLPVATLASQQGCFGDDGLANVPCCQPAQLRLPNFPPFQLTGRWCCIKDCALERDFQVRVTTVHIQVVCDYAVIPITVTPAAAGAPGWSGVLLAKYARTWLEPDAAGRPSRQLWRFLLNGDIQPTAGQPPCPLPPHPAALPTHLEGHIDYACEIDPNGNRVFRMAMNLNHLPGCLSHNFVSCVPLGPGADHQDRSYHLIAPGNFVCRGVPVPSGDFRFEAERSTRFAPVFSCLGEAPVRGQLANQSRNCLCDPTVAGPFSWVHQNLNGSVACAGAVSAFSSLPLAFPLPPLPGGFTSMPIGAWTGPTGSFPGNRELVIHWGVLRFRDDCNPNDIPIQVVHGVSTSGAPGTLFSPNAPLFNTFMDFENMIRPSSLAAGPLSPGWGCLFFSKIVWNISL